MPQNQTPLKLEIDPSNIEGWKSPPGKYGLKKVSESAPLVCASSSLNRVETGEFTPNGNQFEVAG